MLCHNQRCSGKYARQEIIRAFEPHGRVVVVARIPAEVCSVCGDTLFSWEISQRLETLLFAPPTPEQMVPLYAFPAMAEAGDHTRVVEFAATQSRTDR